MPKISVILTSFNHERFIREAIDSVLNQTFTDFELIIWDDASTDGSWEVINSYSDSRIKAFRNEVSKRGIYGINKSISEIATGEYIAIHHSDDVWDLDKLKKQVEFLGAHSEIGAVFTWLQVIDEHGTKLENSWSEQENKTQWQWLEHLFFIRNYLAHPSVLIRKKCYQEVGAYTYGLAQCGDAEMWSRLLIKYPIHVYQEKLTLHRIFSDQSNASGQRPDVQIRLSNEWNIIRENYLSINSFEKIVAIFPNLEIYRNAKGFNTKFLLAMVCLQDSSDRAACRLAITWLFDLIRKPSEAKEIESLYSFTHKDLIRLTGELDVNVLSGVIDLVSHNRVMAQRDTAMAERNTVMAERDAVLVERNTVMAERDAVLVEKNEFLKQRDMLLSSSSWRLTKPLRVVVSTIRLSMQSTRLVLVQILPLLTVTRLKRGFAYLKNADVAGFKSALGAVLRKSLKKKPHDSVQEIISPCQLSEDQPLVSVVIPCFNYGSFVTSAIDSILAQTLKNVEIIVVDGGSTDTSTIKTLQALKRPKTKIWFREGRHLVGDNRNFGIEKSKGRYICCLDADDTLDPSYLEKAVFFLETYCYDIVSTSLNFVGAKTGQIKVLEFPDLTDMVSGNHILTCAVFRKQLWESTGGYVDVGIGKDHVAEDWDFWIRLAAKGARIRNISGEHLFNYRVHAGGSLSNGTDVKSLADQKATILERNKELLTEEAFHISAKSQSRNLWCNPSDTALALNFDAKLTTDKKTLLLALPFSLIGGAERLLSGLCAYLFKNEWRIIVVTTLDQDVSFGSSVDWFKKSSLEIYALPNFLDPKERGDFIQYLIASRRPDCILNAGSRLLYEMLPLIREKYKNLCVVDLLFNKMGHVKSHLEFKKYLTFALAENQEVYDWYLNVVGWPVNRIKLMSSGVDLKQLYPTVRPKHLVKKYAIAENELIIGYSGRLSEEKAPDVFVEIMQLCEKVPNIRFVMTGTGPMTESLIAKFKLLPATVKFEFAGLVEDVTQYFALYDVLLLPSRIDGRPLVVMEALACGVPVIASRVGALPDLIEDGKNGYLLPPANAVAFAEKILNLAENRAVLKQLKVNARLSAEQKLDATLAYHEYEVALCEASKINQN